jgi:hypothetical protein
LLAGRLVAAVRWRTSEDGWEACEQLAPAAWQAVRVRARHWSDWKTIEISPGPSFEGHSLYFYIRRADLEKRYPTLAETSSTPVAAAASTPASPAAPQRKRGPANTHDWHTIDGLIMRCLIDASGRIAVPEKESLIVQTVLAEHDISETEVREAVKRICAEVRKGRKPLEKRRTPTIVRKLR